MFDIEQMKQNSRSRRTFLVRMSAAGLGTAALALMSGCGGGDSSTDTSSVSSAVRSAFPGVSGNSDNIVVLNYAYTLERLEANLYLQALNAASGRPLTTPLDNTTPAAGSTGAYSQTVSNGNISPNFAFPGFLYLVQFAYVEAAHRDFLKAALGANASPVTSASGNYKFATSDGKPGNDLATILSNILPLEETGVRAYLGATPYITDNATAQIAASIYSTECRHSASLEYILGLNPGPMNNIPGVPSGEQEVAAASAPNIFEKFLAPSVVLTAASSAFFA